LFENQYNPKIKWIGNDCEDGNDDKGTWGDNHWYTPSKDIEKFWESDDICFVKPDIISDNCVNIVSESNEYISEEARKKTKIVTKDTIFVTCIGSIGKIGIASEGEFAFNQQINAIIPNAKVNPRYLAYNLGQFTRNYTQTTKRGLLTTNKG